MVDEGILPPCPLWLAILSPVPYTVVDGGKHNKAIIIIINTQSTLSTQSTPFQRARACGGRVQRTATIGRVAAQRKREFQAETLYLANDWLRRLQSCDFGKIPAMAACGLVRWAGMI
jgi:hypothetical protein